MRRFAAGMVAGVFAFWIGGSIVRGQLVNGDFSVDMLTNGTAKYQHVDTGWHSKNAGTNWDIQSGVLEQIGNNGSATRAGQVFSADSLTGTGWFLNFDLSVDSLNRVQLYGGVDDGNNSPGNNVLGFGGDGSPTNNIVVGSWTPLIDESGLNPGTLSFSITDDLSSYDLLALRFRGSGATVGAVLDNVELSQVAPPPPPPPPLGLINGDFMDPALGRGNITYGDLGDGWFGKNAFDGDPGTADNWQIIGEELVQVGNSGSATRVGQLFRADAMTGEGWTFDFEISGDDLLRVQVFAGVDDGNNLNGEGVLSFGGDGSPDDDIVAGMWATLLDESGLAPGAHSFAVPGDLGAYDLIAFRFRGSGGTVGATLDNVAFIAPSVTVPEPAAATVWLMIAGALLGCAGGRRVNRWIER